MPAISKTWVIIADGAVDPDSPLDTALMTGLRDDLVHLREWLGAAYTAGATQNHTHDGVNSALVEWAHIAVFSASGTWTVPAGVTRAKVTVIGGGGGGCGNDGSQPSFYGGHGGGTAIKIVTGLTPGGTVTITVGTGGSGGSSAGPTGGGTGGTSSFGAYCSATGGASASAAGGQGAGSGGDVNIDGGDGNTAGTAWSIGGGSALAPAGLSFGATARAGNFPGGGGTSPSASGTANGGAGAGGVVIIEY